MTLACVLTSAESLRLAQRTLWLTTAGLEYVQHHVQCTLNEKSLKMTYQTSDEIKVAGVGSRDRQISSWSGNFERRLMFIASIQDVTPGQITFAHADGFATSCDDKDHPNEPSSFDLPSG